MWMTLTPMLLFCLLIVQTGVSDPGLVHSPHFGVWWKEIPQPFDTKVEPSFSLCLSPHRPLHSVGDEVHPHNAVHRQDPHTYPAGLGKELTALQISTEWKIRYLKQG